MDTSKITSLLRAKYRTPEYAFIEQVPNATSGRKSRTADAMAMGCWESKGIHLEGFEVKVSRSDWRNELKDMTKSAVFEQHCHRWWIVAAKGIVKPEEMPSQWGLMEPLGGGLTVVKGADLTEPNPVPFTFLAALLRSALSQSTSKSVLQREFQRGIEAGQEKQQWLFRNKDSEREHRQLQKSVSQFELQSGIKITNYNGFEIGSQVAKLSQIENFQNYFNREFSSLKRSFGNIEKMREQLEQIEECE